MSLKSDEHDNKDEEPASEGGRGPGHRTTPVFLVIAVVGTVSALVALPDQIRALTTPAGVAISLGLAALWVLRVKSVRTLKALLVGVLVAAATASALYGVHFRPANSDGGIARPTPSSGSSGATSEPAEPSPVTSRPAEPYPSMSDSPEASPRPSQKPGPSTIVKPDPPPTGGPLFTVEYPRPGNEIPLCIEARGTGPKPAPGYSRWVFHQAVDNSHEPYGPYFAPTQATWAEGKWWTPIFRIGEPQYDGVLLAVTVYLVPEETARRWRHKYTENPNPTVADPEAEGAIPQTGKPVLVIRKPDNNCP